ncbi:histidine phosphotransferase family protein [Pseudogemmobacter bohemicus]|uniref:histidine phosphotransferase family protein n=1 Tax=Pseudogemmobacter bohemicus TaxID=2250708 RepID=UPI000DD3FD2E|nr:histidine phosphotransferase family protein [Pseudogemmobacter bohemicus]
MQDKTDLAALIGSRICHDLISPIGAIGNGVELMMMDRSAASPELALIAESVESANARIRFFRVAFGLAGADQRIARSEVTGILTAMSRGGRLKLDWSSGTDLDRRDVKLAFLLLQCLETALPYGGSIRTIHHAAGHGGANADETGSGEAGWQIVAEAARMRAEPRFWDMFHPDFSGMPASDAEERPVPASHVQFALALGELRIRGQNLSCGIGDGVIRLGW